VKFFILAFMINLPHSTTVIDPNPSSRMIQYTIIIYIFMRIIVCPLCVANKTRKMNGIIE
jgi:hypothetical protein